MDEATLQGLRDAFAASPENTPLLVLLLQGLQQAGEVREARQLVADKDPAIFEGPHRRLAAEICLQASDPQAALELADGPEAEAMLLRAQAFLALDRTEEGRAAYQKAIAANPTLEDPELGALLQSKVRTIDQDGARPRLRVISNDDTEEEETDRLLIPDPEPVTFADVGGLDDLKKQIHKRIILPFQKPSLFERFRKRIGGGILMYGAPGCGKTLLARATAGECKASFFNVAISDVLDMFIGESEQKLHAIFDKARNSAPAVIFFDEIEALGGKRQYNREGTSSKLVSQFLSEMDGFSQDNQGVLVLGATNVPWAVDPAFRRPGRFDRVLFVPPPDRTARAAILERQLKDRPVEPGLDLGSLAAKTSGFSGADLHNLVESAADEAIDASIDSGAEVPIALSHLREALRDVKPTTVEWLTSARNYARYANEGGQYDEVLEFLNKHGKG